MRGSPVGGIELAYTCDVADFVEQAFWRAFGWREYIGKAVAVIICVARCIE
jgi:hypothetical protein